MQNNQGQQYERSLHQIFREGPRKDRRCTDVFCCILYLLLLGSIIYLAVFASSAIQKSQSDIELELQSSSKINPLLAITKAMNYILLSLATVVALCFVLVIISFTIPFISTYVIIPLTLLLMLLLGAGFLYRYFGNKLPFVNENIQNQYSAMHSNISLTIGIAFLAGFVIAIFVFIAKQQRIKFITATLNLSKICFWDNICMIILSFVLSAISIAALYVNIRFLEISQLQQDGQQIINSNLFSLLILIEMAWTHGYLQAYSDFIFQSLTIHWYFNQKQFSQGYSSFTRNLLPSVGLSFRHMGTIVFGSILAFIPQSLNVLLSQCQQKAESCYKCFCICHKCACQHLSKYCYIGTIMYSESFCKGSKMIRQSRKQAKNTFPELYMIGNFYITIIKIFVVFSALIICYFFLAEHPLEYGKMMQLLAPLIVTLLASLQISNHFMNSTGMVGDTIYITYSMDFNNQSKNYGNLRADHCPPAAYEIIKDTRVIKFS